MGIVQQARARWVSTTPKNQHNGAHRDVTFTAMPALKRIPQHRDGKKLTKKKEKKKRGEKKKGRKNMKKKKTNAKKTPTLAAPLAAPPPPFSEGGKTRAEA